MSFQTTVSPLLHRLGLPREEDSAYSLWPRRSLPISSRQVFRSRGYVTSGTLAADSYRSFQLSCSSCFPLAFCSFRNGRVSRYSQFPGVRSTHVDQERMIPWEGHALNCTDTTVVRLPVASFLARASAARRIYTHTPDPGRLSRARSTLSSLVRQKANARAAAGWIYTGKCVRADTLSRLVPYHIAIKMVRPVPTARG